MFSEKKIFIPSRERVPETALYVKIIKKKAKSKEELDSSSPVMLLVPGGPGGNHTVYNEIIDKLSIFCDLILFDPRGCGFSDWSDEKFCTLDEYINDIEEIRAHFNLRRLILFGGSYGAMACIGYAIKYPNFLEKMIVLNGASSGAFIETAKKNLEERGSLEQKKIAEKLWNGLFLTSDEFFDFYQKMMSLYSVSCQENIPTIRSSVPYNVAITNLGFKTFLRTFNFSPFLDKIKCETLFICGDQDWINDSVYATFSAGKVAKSTLRIFDHCGHFVWKDQPNLFFETVQNFLVSA